MKKCPDNQGNTGNQAYSTSCSGEMKEKIYLLMKKTKKNLSR